MQVWEKIKELFQMRYVEDAILFCDNCSSDKCGVAKRK